MEMMKRLFKHALVFGALGASLAADASAQKIYEESTDHWAREVEQCYLRGIGYLVRSQNEKGFWTDDSYGSETKSKAFVSEVTVSWPAS